MSRLMENKVGIVTAAGNGIGRASECSSMVMF